MAYVSVPKDLSLVKNKVLFSLTSRQLICFGAAAAVGVPAYIFTRGAIGNSAAALLMIVLMLPLFFLAMYERDGQPAEKILRNYARARFFWPGKRPYRTENFYQLIVHSDEFTVSKTAKVAPSTMHYELSTMHYKKGGNAIAAKRKTASKTSRGKHRAGKTKPRR